jgi:pimaricinolide synthase PimS1
MLEEFGRVAGEVAFSAPRIPVVCSVTGQPDPELMATSHYWVRQAREAVRFADCARWMASASAVIFTELGPDGVLSALGPAALASASTGTVGQHDAGNSGGVWLPVLRAGRPEPTAVLSAAAEAFVRGVEVDWAEVYAGSGARRADLPTYAFQRQRYWPGMRPAEGMPVAGEDGAEAGFWAAVDRQDLAGLAGALHVRVDEPLSAVVPILAAWRRRRQLQSAVEDWRYQVTWQPVAGLGDGAVLAGRWLLVTPVALAGSEVAAACTQALAGGGAEVVTVDIGPADLDRQVLTARLRQGVAAGDGDGGRFAGVVSLLALDEAELAGCAGVAAGVAATLLLVQALGDVGIDALLWALTRGAVLTGGEPAVRVAQAQVWGLGRVAALEYPQRWGGLIDRPPALTGQAAGWLRAVLAGDTGEDQVAIREAGALARRLVRPAAAITASRPWQPRGPVLVTGGTGALGGQVARWLASGGAPRVILVSRSGIAAIGAAALAACVCGQGAAVTVAACDVADRPDLAGLWTRLAGAGIAMRAVIHTAGVLDDGVVDALSPARLATVLAPKAAAAAHLAELTEGSDLDAFVLFSSIAGAMGASGQGNYAAANAALDAIAEHRRACGLAATSVAWGVWGGGGMAGQAVAERARRSGVVAMVPRLAISALGEVLAQDQATAMIADMDWARFAPGFTMLRPSPLLTGIAEARQAVEAASTRPAGQGLLADRLAGLPAAGQEELVLELVCQDAAAVLGHTSAAAVRPGAVFRDLGFDSLTAIELRNRLGVATGLQLPATLIFDYPTPLELARWLRTVMSPAASGSADASAEEAGIRQALASIPLARLRGAGLIGPLLRLAAFQAEEFARDEENETDSIDAMGTESLIRMAHGNADV